MSNKIITTKDGSHSILSEQFGVSYHSIHGALQETYHVFINAGFHFQVEKKNDISILEIGWGSGLNSLVTFLEQEKTTSNVQYTTVEAYPISIDIVKQLNYDASLDAPISLLELHQLEWNKFIPLSPTFQFKKLKKKFQEIEDKNQYDLIYFDAFAPNAQAEFWEAPFLEKMYAALQSDGTLVTYCAKGSFKRALKAVGFIIEALPGPPGKREMTRALKP